MESVLLWWPGATERIQVPLEAIRIATRSVLLTLPEAAKYLRMPVATLRSNLSRDPANAPIPTRIGRRVMFRLSDLDDFVESKRGSARARVSNFAASAGWDDFEKRRAQRQASEEQQLSAATQLVEARPQRAHRKV